MSTHINRHARQDGYVVALMAATFLMGSSFPASKILLQKVPPFALAGWRFLLASLVTMTIAWVVHGTAGCVPRAGKSVVHGWIVVMSIGLLQTAGTIGLLFFAMQTIPASTAAILLFTNPLWVAILGRLVLDEHLSGVQSLAMLLGIIGVVFAIGLHLGGSLGGVIAGLGASVCWAVATILAKRFQISVGIWAFNGLQMFFGALVLLILATLTQQTWPQNVSTVQWAWFVWLAIPASTGSFGLWFLALKRGGATHVSGFLFLVPLFAVILSFFILGERLGISQIAGGILIGIALWFLNKPRVLSEKGTHLCKQVLRGRTKLTG